MTYLNIFLDLVMIGLLGAGISYAVKLTGQLADMRKHRAEMERFVVAFTSTVERAEAGIRGLKTAARSSGDDLEQLIEKGTMLRDELMFLTDSADQMATRLANAAGRAPREEKSEAKPEPRKPVAVSTSAPPQSQPSSGAGSKVSSTAERDLLRALGKRG